MGQDAFQAADLLGSVVDDRFEILARLGEGGMGAVYKARQISMDREVALKILLHDQRGDPISVERFRHEAYLASRLNHPNAIVIHDFGQSADGLLYIAMEFLLGETLKERIRRAGQVPLKSALAIASQTLRVLAEAHRMGLVHRDIKPDNIFLTHMEGDPDFVKVLDFGIAKLTAVREGIDGYQGGLTIKGKIYGTPNYMSPEQIRGKPLDHQSDLYSFGVVMYELLTGRMPFEAETPVDVMMMHLRDPPPSLCSLRPEVGAELENVVLRALEKDRRLRFQSADEFLEAIESYKFASGFYAVPARLMARSAEEPADDDEDLTGALGATLMAGKVPGQLAAPEEDDDDHTLMGGLVQAAADERTMMEFGDAADEKTAFEEEGDASAESVGESVFELLEDSLLSPAGAAKAELLSTGVVSVVRPGPAQKAAPRPAAVAVPQAIARPAVVDPVPPPAAPGRALGPTPAPRPLGASPLAPSALVPTPLAPSPLATGSLATSALATGSLAARTPAPLPATSKGLAPIASIPPPSAPSRAVPAVLGPPASSVPDGSVLDAEDLEEVEPSRLVPIPHFDDSLGGQDGARNPGRAVSEPLPASPFSRSPTVAAKVPAVVAEAPRAPAVAQRAAASRAAEAPVPVASPAPLVSGRMQAQPQAPAPLRTAASQAAQPIQPIQQQPIQRPASVAVPAARVQDIATVGTDPRQRIGRKSRKGLIIGLTAAVLVFGAALVVLLVIKPFGGSKPAATAAPAGPAKLAFASDPEGLEVFRNGRFIGETPVSQEFKDPGETHELQVATRTSTFRITVPATPESTWVFIHVPEKAPRTLGHLLAVSRPTGQPVRHGGKEIGQTPLVVIGPLDGTVELEVGKEGQSKKAGGRTTAAGERVEVVLE